MRKASIKTLLEYTPYDNKCPSPFGMRESENEEEEKFYENKLFVDYPQTCDDFRTKLSRYIEEQTIHLITFSGSSGSGKTTFLKNFFRINKEYHCKYINLVGYPSALGNDETVATAIKSGLKAILSKITAKLLYETFREWDNKGSHADDLISSFLPNELSRFMSFCESFSQEDVPLRFESEMEKFDFYRKNNLKQLLSLYMISSIVTCEKDDESPFVFVFDNLDEVDKHYIRSALGISIYDSYSIAQIYCEQVLRYNFSWNVTFLLSVRMENQRYLRISDIQERTNILHTNTRSLEFSHEYQATYSDIINARLLYYENNCRSGKPNEINIKNNYDGIKKLLRAEEIFFKRFIKPLYSYDYRMFTHFAISDLLEEETVFIPKPLLEQCAEKDCHQGASGMLLFYSLAGLLGYAKSRFSSYVNEEFSGENCNIFRMSFTLLSNLSGWSRRNEALMELLEDKDDFNEKTNQVEMTKFLYILETWYKNEKTMICDVLRGLIGTSANSFECPILLFGNAIDECVRVLGEKFSVEALADKIVQDYLDDSNSLASVTIQVNPLCIVYAARVFIHYEYFNLISPNYMKISKNETISYSPKPLFQFIDFNTDMQIIKECLFYTFETAKTIIKKADNHFCKTCKARNNDSCVGDCKSFINKFKEDGFSFNNTIHATRIISAHIHYLENYRHYLWYKIGNSNNHSDEEIEIQRIVINQILKYIEFYEGRDVKDDLYETITKNFKKQYDNALKELINSKQYPNVDLIIKRT